MVPRTMRRWPSRPRCCLRVTRATSWRGCPVCDFLLRIHGPRWPARGWAARGGSPFHHLQLGRRHRRPQTLSSSTSWPHPTNVAGAGARLSDQAWEPATTRSVRRHRVHDRVRPTSHSAARRSRAAATRAGRWRGRRCRSRSSSRSRPPAPAARRGGSRRSGRQLISTAVWNWAQAAKTSRRRTSTAAAACRRHPPGAVAEDVDVRIGDRPAPSARSSAAAPCAAWSARWRRRCRARPARRRCGRACRPRGCRPRCR